MRFGLVSPLRRRDHLPMEIRGRPGQDSSCCRRLLVGKIFIIHYSLSKSPAEQLAQRLAIFLFVPVFGQLVVHLFDQRREELPRRRIARYAGSFAYKTNGFGDCRKPVFGFFLCRCLFSFLGLAGDDASETAVFGYIRRFCSAVTQLTARYCAAYILKKRT